MSFANVGFGVSAKIAAGTKAAVIMHPIRTLDRMLLFLLMWQRRPCGGFSRATKPTQLRAGRCPPADQVWPFSRAVSMIRNDHALAFIYTRVISRFIRTSQALVASDRRVGTNRLGAPRL